MQRVRRFLMSRFILILVVVSLVEYGLMKLYNILWWPFLQHILESQINLSYEFKRSEIVLLTVISLIRFLLMLAANFLPGPAKLVAVRTVSSFEKSAFTLLPQNMQDGSIYQMDRASSLIFFGSMVIACILFLFPYLLGAIWFAKITTIEVARMEAEKDAQKKEMEQKRNLMLSDIAHDLRTPITTVSGYAKALADGMVSDPVKQQEYLEAIQVKSARMNELISLLFEYVKLDSEGFSLERKPVDLAELLRQNAALMYSDVENANMELIPEIPEEKCMVYGDNIQLSRVITNLITNAIRHSKGEKDQGASVKILLSLEELNGRVYLAVADNGEDIPEELAKHLFEPFAMGDNSRNSKGGSGLGLSIAHKIICKHGWNLSLVKGYKGYTKAFLIEIPEKHFTL